MKLIEKCISTLSEAEKKAFTNYLGRKNNSASRQDVKYVKQIDRNLPSKTNKEAALRKRIKNELAGFVALMNSEKKISGSALDTELELAIYLLDNKINKEGWWLLKKVESKAINEMEHTTLSRAYMAMIEYAQSEHAYPIDTILKLKFIADEKKQKDEGILIEMALIKEKLHQNKVKGKVESLTAHNSKAVRNLLNDDAIYHSPHHALSLLEIIRSTYLSERKLDQMGSIAVDIYNKINPENWSAKKNNKVHARFQYIMAHSYYRQKKFNELDRILRSFRLNLNSSEKRLMLLYEPKIVALKTASLFLLNKIDEAVEKLEQFLHEKTGKISIKDDLNMHLTLVVLLDCQGSYTKANKYFLNFHHSDSWCTKKMGTEWVLRKNIIHAMVLFDCGRDDLANTKILQIIKNNKDMLKAKHYAAIQPFLLLLSSFLENPKASNKDELLSIEQRLVHAKNEQSLKKLSYLAWLKARVSDHDFYTEIKEIVSA